VFYTCVCRRITTLLTVNDKEMDAVDYQLIIFYILFGELHKVKRQYLKPK